jgi:TetR/AcrR family transcriptional regulator, transcriptional repressor of bet genes
MARPSVDIVRRKELVQATMTAIHRAGLAEPTLAAICKYAGLASVSMVNHYFDSKQHLLESTMQELSADFLMHVASGSEGAQSAVERVYAVIDANFAPSQCTPEAVASWLWFWSRTPSNAVFARIERATYRQIITELTAGLAEILPAGEVKDAAESLMALMYGLWLRFALNPKLLDVESARRITRQTFELRVSVAASTKR